MQFKTLFLLLLSCLTVSAYGQSVGKTPLFPVDGTFVLSPKVGSNLLTQCSRDTPKVDGEYWTPSVSDITELELALQHFLTSLKQRGAPIPSLARSYNRQYVGFVKDGVRFIYGNFYPHDMSFREGESTTPLVICDGGPAFWGIVYRMDTREFEEPQMNGSI